MAGGSTPHGSPIDAWREDLEMNAAARENVTDEQKRKNLWTNLEAVGGVTPIIGNVLSARDAVKHGKEAATAAGEGKKKDAAINTGLFGLDVLGAVMGLPFGKLAGKAAKEGSRTAGVFVPVEKDVGDLHALRDAGVSNRDIWQETGLSFEPGGKLQREIFDNKMGVDLRGAKVGDHTTLGQIADHPELFNVRPELANKPVKFTDIQNKFGAASSRTNPSTGDFEISLLPSDKRADIAKLMQYDISAEAGFPQALRHGTDKAGSALSVIEAKAKASGVEDDALAEYLASLDKARGLLNTSSGGDIRVGANSAGNMQSKAVAGRAVLDEPERLFPWVRKAPYLSRNPKQRPPAFKDIITLPPAGASLDEVAAFLQRWKRFGAGRGE